MLTCFHCDAYAVVERRTERLGDGAILDSEPLCFDHAVALGVRGAEPLPKLVVVEGALVHGSRS